MMDFKVSSTRRPVPASILARGGGVFFFFGGGGVRIGIEMSRDVRSRLGQRGES